MSPTTLKEAERVMTICNACRYCEGFCAVFPAMELRRTFTAGDLRYLSNLCHNCRDCYYACQYAPPHEFDLNFPRSMARLRMETYREAAWPATLGRLFGASGVVTVLAAVLGVAAVLLPVLAFQGSAALFGVHRGAGAFYRVVPYPVMVGAFLILAAFAAAGLLKGAAALVERSGGRKAAFREPRAVLRALLDAARLTYLAGGGHGCNYPDDRFSMIRRNLHHAVFYGFVLCLAATVVAAFYDHFLHRPAPYPFFSWPVVLGTVGGLGLAAGTGGLLWLKARLDREPSEESGLTMDVGFLLLLFGVALSGLLLLVFRGTALMGLLLAGHLGLVAALFVTMPYGKFVHGVHRFAALVRNADEQRRSG